MEGNSRPIRHHPFRLGDDQYAEPHSVVFVTARAKPGAPLDRPELAQALAEAMASVGTRQGVSTHAYCVMPDHLHAVVSLREGGGNAATWVRYVKRQVSRVVPALVWQRSYWDRHARAEDDVPAMVEYALANPVRAGLCAEWDEWPYSWSQWHAETRGPAPVVGAPTRAG